jgi:hypothetical protein
MSIGLPVSRLINVSVNLTPLGAQYANFNSLLLLGSSDVIDTFERIRTYNDLASVAGDFGTSAPEYLAAALFFGQSPQPTVLNIGRWAQAATSGLLRGGVLTAAQQLLSAWTGITNGGVNFTINGTARNLSSLNFSAATNMNGVASVINTALGVNGTCVWNGSQFIVSSATTGTASIVAMATTGAGTDISAQVKLTSATASYAVAGIAAETAVAAVAALDNLSTNWYALTMVSASAVAADHLAIAAYIQGANTKHLYGITSQDTAALLTTDTTSIGYQMKQLGYTRVCTQYSSSNPYAICSLFGRILTTDFTANNSVITLMYKQEPGVAPEGLSASQVAALELNYYNYFAQYNNNTAIIANGQMASGNYFDEVYGTDWLANYIQTNVYNLLYQSPTKIPQTDPGTHLIVTAVEASCSQAVSNGLLAPGTWDSQGFGELKQGSLLPKGYYVYAAPVATQSAADRAARKSVPIQVAAKLAGAVHKVNVLINVNR